MMKKCLMKQYLAWGLLCLLLVVQTSLGASFKEVDGMLVIEAENFDAMRADTASGQEYALLTGPLPSSEGSLTTASSNDAYVESPKPNTNDTNYGNLSDAVAEAPRLDYYVFLEGGTYKFWSRGSAQAGGSDTHHIGINYHGNGLQGDGTNNSINGIDFANDDGWNWSQKTQSGSNVIVIPGPGEYVINIYQRENGCRVDKFILTSDLDWVAPAHDDFGPDETAGGISGAHTPEPTGLVESRQVPVTQVTWQDPLLPPDPDAEPNIVSVDQYDITYYILDNDDIGADDPNWAIPGFTYGGATDVSSPYNDGGTLSVTNEQTMFWRVDTHVIVDSNEVDGATASPPYTVFVEGSNWSFETEPAWTPPALAMGDTVLTTLTIQAGQPAVLTGTVTGNSDPILTPTWTAITPGGNVSADVSASVPSGVGNDYGYINPEATFTAAAAGNYLVELTITDGTGNTNADGDDDTETGTIGIHVLDNDCEAAKIAEEYDWDPDYFDVNEDCLVDLEDLDPMAKVWLDSTELIEQGTTDAIIGYVPDDVFASRIEAESADPNDPSAWSDYPITDGTGIRIEEQPNASGGQALGYASATAWVQYEIDVPVGADGVPVDVYAGHALNGSGTVTLSFGTEATPDAYGVGNLDGTGNWTNFTDGGKIGAVTFGTTGLQTVRISFGGGLNLDWFNFDWPTP